MFSNVNSWNSDREKEKERGSMTERKWEGQGERNIGLNSFVSSANNSNNLSPPPSLLVTNMQLTHMQRWDTEFVGDWVFCSPVGMVEWFLVLQKKEEVFGV